MTRSSRIDEKEQPEKQLEDGEGKTDGQRSISACHAPHSQCCRVQEKRLGLPRLRPHPTRLKFNVNSDSYSGNCVSRKNACQPGEHPWRLGVSAKFDLAVSRWLRPSRSNCILRTDSEKTKRNRSCSSDTSSQGRKAVEGNRFDRALSHFPLVERDRVRLAGLFTL